MHVVALGVLIAPVLGVLLGGTVGGIVVMLATAVIAGAKHRRVSRPISQRRVQRWYETFLLRPLAVVVSRTGSRAPPVRDVLKDRPEIQLANPGSTFLRQRNRRPVQGYPLD